MRTSKVAVVLAGLALAVGCSEDDGFVEPPAPESLSIVGGNPQTGTTGLPLGQTLQVRVLSDAGSPLAGVTVTWAATAGTLFTPTSVTNGDGIAINTWTLGAAAGQQTVTATAPGTNTVTFTATASAPVAFLLQRSAGNAQVSLPGEALTPIRVRLLDNNGLPLAGAQVTFTVLTGGGSVAPVTATTNALGEAATVWTLGAQGPQTLRASAPGAGSVTFTATAADPCVGARDFSALTAGARMLDATDCLLTSGPRAGSFIEYFNRVQAAATSATYTLSSTAFDPYLVISRGADTVARNDNASGTTTNAAIRIFLGPATYRFGATSAVAGQTGAYTFSSGPVGDVAGCAQVFITRGANVGAQATTTADCQAFAGFFSDQYTIYIRAGETVVITQGGPMDTYITLFGPSGAIVDERDNGGPGTAEVLTYTATTAGFYRIDAGAFDPGEIGSYTLTIGA